MLRTTMKPNETVEKPLVRKTFIKISHNWLKTRQNVVRNTKTRRFSAFLSHFSKSFLKGDFFDSFNGWCYLWLRRNRLGNGKLSKLRISSKNQRAPSSAGIVGRFLPFVIYLQTDST